MTQVIPQQVTTHNTARQVYQPGHGFNVGNAIHRGAAGWELSEATDISTLKEAMVSRVDSPDVFVLTYGGTFTWPGCTLVPGIPYYLSPTIPGTIQDKRPRETGQYVQPCVIRLENEDVKIIRDDVIRIGSDFASETYSTPSTIGSSVLNGYVTGGGGLTWNANGRFKWSQRAIWISQTKNDLVPEGYFDINMPPAGTVIPFVGSASTDTTTADGVYITNWYNLWYILPLGKSSRTVNTNFRLTAFSNSSGFVPEPHWVRLLAYNQDNTGLYWCDGRIVHWGTKAERYLARAGDTSTGTLTFANGAVDSVAVNCQGRYITNVHAPGSGGDLANKTYVDARVAKSGDTMTGQLTVNANVLADGGDFYADNADNNNNSGKSIFFRSSDGQTNAQLVGRKINRTGGTNDAQFDLSMGCGGYGFDQVFVTQVASPPNMRFDGDVYSKGASLASDATLKTDIKEVNVSDVIDQIHPIEFRFRRKLGEGADLEWANQQPDPELRLGFCAQEVQKVDSRLVSEDGDGTLALDTGGMITVVLAAIQRNEERIVYLESLVINNNKE
jgi:hypothetical protein